MKSYPKVSKNKTFSLTAPVEGGYAFWQINARDRSLVTIHWAFPEAEKVINALFSVLCGEQEISAVLERVEFTFDFKDRLNV